MVSEEKAKRLIVQNVYKTLDALGYGKKMNLSGIVMYLVGNRRMTLSEYQDYCIKKELKKFDINY